MNDDTMNPADETLDTGLPETPATPEAPADDSMETPEAPAEPSNDEPVV